MNQNKKFLNVTFWLSHFLLIFSVAWIGPSGNNSANGSILDIFAVICFFVGIFLLIFVYPFAIGGYASKFGKNGFMWGVLTFIFSPMGTYVSYVATFFFKGKVEKS